MNFTHDEFAVRLTKTRAEMDTRGIDLLFVTDPSNMAWLTGYDGWSFYTHQCVIIKRAEPGLKKNELVAAIYAASIEGIDDCWGDYPAIVPLTPSGMDATAPHLTWDDSPMKSGECTFFEIAGVHKRYHCPQSRTLFLGEPPDKYRRAEAAVLEAVDAGLAMAKPGNRCADIAKAFNSTLKTHGFEKDNRCGYSIGLSYPPASGSSC